MAVALDSGFEILRVSDVRFQKITTEIQYHGEQIAQLNIDQGADKIEIEFLTSFIGKDFSPKFQFDDFIEAASAAKTILIESV